METSVRFFINLVPVLPSFDWICRLKNSVLPSFTGFYWLLSSLIGFSWLKLGFTRLYMV